MVLSIGWIANDRMVRDGDEEGHVGAAELFLEDLSRGDWSGFFERLWMGDMGEYPQAFTAGVGAWWWALDSGLPGHPAVRAVCLLSLLIAALATGRLARRLVKPMQADLAELLAMGTVLLLPLANGLTRHFMPEGALIAAVAVTLLAAMRLVEHPSLPRAVVLGACIGLGLLVKQTFVFLAVVPLILVLRRQPRIFSGTNAAVICTTAVVAGPWWVRNLDMQRIYGSASMATHGDGGLLEHIAYYPLTSLWLGLGPVIGLAALCSVAHLIRTRARWPLQLGAAWLLGGLLLLTLVPKKYPRLMAPLLPGAALWIAAAIATSKRPRRWWALGGAGAATWVGLGSTLTLPLHPINPAIDPGCPQVWFRPSVNDDLGLASVTQAIASLGEGPVQVNDAPAIPCSVQTTHDWVNHLAPYLRRSGLDREVWTDPSQPASIVVDWTQGPGTSVDVPALNATVWIRRATLDP